jgi:molybdenum cofactor synthesis domain-containing protein
MNIPDIFEALIITLSDRACSGEYSDLSGPRITERLSGYFPAEGWRIRVQNTLIPDDAEMLSKLVRDYSEKYNIIFTTGGTGIGPRDITVEAVSPLLDREIPGIMEFIRIKHGMENPNALLSRGVAGIRGKALIFTLPGSLKAVDEYMNEILKVLKHAILMQYGVDMHHKHQ